MDEILGFNLCAIVWG